jgi:DNA-binding CsgD family transcriptional regulator
MLSISRLNEMAAIAAEAADATSYETELLRVIDRVVGSDVLFFKRNGVPGPVILGIDADTLRGGERQLLDCRDEAGDVLLAARRQDGVALDLEVFGARGLERKRYYQLVMRPLGGRCTAFLPAEWQGQDLSVLALGRIGRPYSARELERLRQMAPTLRLCEALQEARARMTRALGCGPALLPALTRAERDVLSYLRLGYTNADIARARSSALRTVRNQLSSAYAKLGVASRAEAVAVLGLLDLHDLH